MESPLNWFVTFILFISSFSLADVSIPTAKIPSVTQGKPNLNCPQFQPYGYPSAADSKIVRRSFHTCRVGYARLYDPTERTPLWVAEHLKKSNFFTQAERDQLDFIPDPNIPGGALPSASDYEGSGYDKGHMAPAADFKSSQIAMNSTFRFGNAIPQTPQSNRGVWKQLEDATREVAIRRGEIYVITGPIYTVSRA